MVGTPCQVNGVRLLQRYGWNARKRVAEAVKLIIGLLCTRSFNIQKLLAKLKTFGIEARKIKKMDVNKGLLTVIGKENEVLLEKPIKEFWETSLRGCDECADFTGRLADIAVGSIGSPPGFSTVIIRTEAGERAWEKIRD